MKQFRAPWSISLIVMSAFVTLCLGVSIGIPLPKHIGTFSYFPHLLPASLVPIGLLFVIRGYTITEKEILIHRLLWATRLSREGLQSAVFAPEALSKSIRTFGNGGFYSFTGFYWNKTLGTYRAFLTDPKKTVVLKYAHRVVVVSPENPEEFIRELGFGA